MKEVWNGLPTYAKGVIAIALVAAAGFAGWKIYKFVVGLKDSGGSRAENKDAASELRALKAKGMKPSFSASQYTQWANQLKEAFDGCGTAWETIKPIFEKLRNDVDWLTLRQEYGTRKFDECGWGTGDYEGTLTEALAHELDGGETEELNELMKKAKITYTI